MMEAREATSHRSRKVVQMSQMDEVVVSSVVASLSRLSVFIEGGIEM